MKSLSFFSVQTRLLSMQIRLIIDYTLFTRLSAICLCN